MKIISWNINGIRSALRDDFVKSFKKINADIFCLQEVKARVEQLPDNVANINGYNLELRHAVKKGYSGVAVYSKNKPKEVITSLRLKRFDDEGRILLSYYNDLIFINVYIPHGGRQKENLDYKLKVYSRLIRLLKENKDKKVIIVGDFNIAHQDIDLDRPKSNRDNIMFTPKERKQIDRITDLGFVDTFRQFNKDSGNYTWWPYMANCRARNIGWRIDYIFVSKRLVPKLKDAFILKDVRGSDHCPIGIEIEL